MEPVLESLYAKWRNFSHKSIETGVLGILQVMDKITLEIATGTLFHSYCLVIQCVNDLPRFKANIWVTSIFVGYRNAKNANWYNCPNLFVLSCNALFKKDFEEVQEDCVNCQFCFFDLGLCEDAGRGG